MNLPELSVVMPNYNHGRYLARSLPAVLGQSVPPLEVIIIDDASTDNSPEIIQDFARRYSLIRFHRQERNQGVVAAMNLGLNLARGQYIYYAAADDEALPGLFEKSLTLLTRHPQAALSCSISEWREIGTGLNRHMGVGMGSRPAFYSPANLLRLEQEGKLLISPHTAVLRKAAIQEAGGFRPEFKWHCDWFAIYVAAFRHGICFLPEALAVFNIYPSSFSLEGSQRRHDHREVLTGMLDRLLQPQYDDVRPLLQKSGALFLFGEPLFRLVMGNSKYRGFRTPAYLRKAVWQMLRMRVKKFTPRFLANWYFHLCGYKVRGA